MFDRVVSREVAILGYGCRLPGAASPEALWALLTGRRCAIGEIGPDRWAKETYLSANRSVSGVTYTAAAGLLDDPFAFDAGFFGVSPREAVQMDPQQRLLLHVAWEAVEMAGLTPADLSGPRTGVFVGASGLDYSTTIYGDPSAGDAQFMTGNTLSIIANRLAHVLDARGPSHVIDTACSSSLFAFEAAWSAVASGAIDRAVVGGVNLLLSPMPFLGFARAGMLSPTGLCKPFDARADGYVRAEGAVAFVIEARETAEADGRRARGYVVGAAVNSDGRQGALSVPNGRRQEDLMRRVYAEAGASADDLAFLEAHGTGTMVGDPIEASAIGAALGRARSAPLPIGSAKSNIGHLEPASGLAGLLKAQLALERGLIPATLHVETPNPAIPFDELNLAVAIDAAPLPARARPWLAGVNSFGFGGANAHVAIRQPDAPAPAAAADLEASVRPLILSAATTEALQALARRWRDRLAAATPAEATALTALAAHRRARNARRLVVAEPAAEGRLAALSAFAEGGDAGLWAAETASAGDGAPVAFLFSGNGSQWPGMGRAAFAGDAAFRAGFETTAACVLAEGGADLVEALHADDLAELLTRAEIAQPLLLGLQTATVDALAARGVRPMAVAGHSVGEVAAAWASGALSREQAARLAVRRARRQGPLHGKGAMAAVLAPADACAALIADLGLCDIDIAADNSPRGATVSGAPEAVEALIAAARERRLAVRRLKVDYPFHGPLMERIREALRVDLADMAPAASTIPFVSTTEGRVVRGEALDGGYWWRNARQPVLFRQAALALSALGARAFVEIGPQPSLQNYVADTLAPTGAPHVCLPSLKRQGAGAEDFALIAARVAAAGGAVDDAALFGPKRPMTIDGPSYPWSVKNYRFTLSEAALNVLRTPAVRPLLGWRPFSDEGGWRVTLDQSVQTWLVDHAVDGTATLPAAAFVEMALAAAAETHGEAPLELTDFDILLPLTVEARARVEARTTLDPESGAVRIESRSAPGEAGWTLHAAGAVRIARCAAPDDELGEGPDDRRSEPAEATPDPALYEALARVGLDYGPAFRRAARPTIDGATARAALSASLVTAERGWVVDPTDLDAAFHVAAPLFDATDDMPEGVSLLPVRIGRLLALRPGAQAARVEARLTRRGARGAAVAFTLRDAEGRATAVVEGARFAAVRLRRRAPLASKLWREALVPRRLRAEAAAATPDLWADPAARLAALGLTVAEPPAPDDAALLLDAMARRIAWDATEALGPAGGVRLRARKMLPQPLRRALDRGLDALAEDGAYDPATDALDGEPPAPTLETLALALTTATPDAAAALMEALGLAARFEAALAGSVASAAGAPEADATEPATRRRAFAADTALEAGLAALASAAADLAASWPDDAPLDALVIGRCDSAARALSERATRLRAVASADDPDMAAALDSGPWDVIIAAGETLERGDALAAAQGALAGGGLLLAALPRPSLLADMLARAAGADPADSVSGTACAPGAAPIATCAECRLLAVRRATPDQTARVLDIKGRIGLVAPTGEPAAEALTHALAAAGARARPAQETDGLAPGEPAIVFASALAQDAAGDAPEIRLAARMMALRDMAEAAGDARLWLLAPGALSDGAAADPDMAALARLRRVLVNERPSLRLGVIDADDPTARAVDIAAAALGAAGDETEIVLRGGAAFTPRAVAAPALAALAERRSLGPGAREPALALAPDATGGLETLRWRPIARRAPGPNEIEIEIAAAGLNFRDVMWSMGVLPEEAVEDGFAGAGVGMECAGVVRRAGPGARFSEGDRVIAFTANALATHATLAADLAAPIPEGLGMAAAATLPVVFGTAWRGLIDLGRLEPGETALIHGGAGGVGLAAIQIARARGARVIATAGSPAKRALARMLGADEAFDSRSLAFADAVMAATDGRGVDVALNSLSGAAMEATLGCMAAFGRFIELGKRDYYANTRIGLRPMRRNIAYHGVDLDAMLKVRPDAGGRLLAEIAREVGAGRFSPLPFQLHAADDAIGAFRLMQRAGHVGKVVVTPPDAPEACEPAGPLARAEGAYLVTGGARGFGLAFAERLAARGARRLWLTSRTGAADEARIARLKSRGVSVETAACDAANEAEMAALMARIDAAGAPLLGVCHAAMALDDGLMSGMTAARIAASLRPKLFGAQVLDRLTRDRQLDFFVMFSSVSALFGNPGQGAYVAANAGLEALAARRRAEGLPALAMGFGPIADAGVLASDARARERLERRGAGLLTSRAALDALEAALAADDAATATAAPMRWGALAADLATLGEPLFERLDRSDAPTAAAADGGESLAEMIAGLDEAAAVKKLAALFRAEAAIILRQPPEEVDPTRPLSELGFDSLMGMELKLSAEEKFGATLPAIALADGATLTTLAARMAADLRAAEQGSSGPAPDDDAMLAALASRHLGGQTAAAMQTITGAVAGQVEGAKQ